MGTVVFPGYDPAPGDLYVPLKGLYSIKPGTTVKDIDDLSHRLGGRGAKPKGALAVHHADQSVTFIPGLGVTEAAELQDLAYGVLEKRQKQNRGEWFDAWRERNGLVPREQFGAAFSNAVHDRIERHKHNPVTDPAREPGYEGKRLY